MATLPFDLPKRLRAAGLRVVVIRGWRNRGRPASTGGYAGGKAGVLWHHTGSAARGWSLVRELAYAKWLFLTGRSDLPAPLCQLSIGASGTVYVGAAGRGNHAGKAKASGTMAAGDGNELYTGVECMNSGSEGWPTEQVDAMVKVGLVLADINGYSFEAQRGHKETSVTGKWDPGGFDMDAFRARMKAVADRATRPAADETSVQARAVGTGWAPAKVRNAIGRMHDLGLLALTRAEDAGQTRRASKLNEVLEALPGSKRRRA